MTTAAPSLDASGPAMLPLPPAFAVSLIDRRTGRGHRINGSPLVLFSRQPELAAAELLAGRDPQVWETRIEPIGGRA